MTQLRREFFERDTLDVARDLLGQVLVHEVDGRRVAARVVEVEAYQGVDDLASHGSRGRTARNEVMFGPVGVSYVYLIYGMYWLLNVVAKPPGADYPAAILLRAAEPLEGLDVMAARRDGRPLEQWTSGPGRLTMALGVGKAHHGLDMTAPGSPLRFEAGEPVPDERVASGPRVGINVPEPWQSKPWRFWVKGSPFVSRGE